MRPSRHFPLIAAVVLAACGGSDGDPAPPPPPETPPAPVTALRDEVAVSDISVLQVVKTTLVKDGEVVAAPNAPIIAGRPAYVRVFFKATARTRPTLAGELRVKRAGKDDLVLRDAGKVVMPELDEELLAQTLNFEIAAEDMTADAAFSVKVGVSLEGAETLAFPADGSALPFGAKSASQKLRVKLVPVTYEAVPGESVTPDLSNLKPMIDTLYKLYPVASVEMTVRTPLKWTKVIEPRGKGWSDLLSGIMQVRSDDVAERDVYYVGMFTPKKTMEEFCVRGGCILGLAPLAEEREVGMRAAILLGYQTRELATTMPHELAHAMGRQHAPCGGPEGVDDDFPYGSGGIGVFGYDVLQKKLIDPGQRYRDLMTYCGPEWISDYTYRALYERMEALTKQQAAIDAGMQKNGTGNGGMRPSETVQSFRVSPDGTVLEGPAVEVLAGDDSGEQVTVSYEAALGNVLSTAKGRVRHLSETGDSIVLAPEAPIGATRARLGAMGVTKLRTRVLGPR